MAIIEVKVPDIGDFSDVPVIDLFVKVGDAIKVDDAICTLESDKATMDIPSPAAGVVKSVVVKVGDRVSEGSAVVVLLVPIIQTARDDLGLGVGTRGVGFVGAVGSVGLVTFVLQKPQLLQEMNSVWTGDGLDPGVHVLLVLQQVAQGGHLHARRRDAHGAQGRCDLTGRREAGSPRPGRREPATHHPAPGWDELDPPKAENRRPGVPARCVAQPCFAWGEQKLMLSFPHRLPVEKADPVNW